MVRIAAMVARNAMVVRVQYHYKSKKPIKFIVIIVMLYICCKMLN